MKTAATGFMVEATLFMGFSLLVMAALWWPAPQIAAWLMGLAFGAGSEAGKLAAQIAGAVPSSILLGRIPVGPIDLAIVGGCSTAAGFIGDYRMATRGYPVRLRFLLTRPETDDEEEAR